MSGSASVQSRLETQLEALDVVLVGTTPALLDWRPASGDWSARENLAHLARHGIVFLERLDRILREETPRLGRYSAGRSGVAAVVRAAAGRGPTPAQGRPA